MVVADTDQVSKAHQKIKATKHSSRGSWLFIIVPVATLLCATAMWGGPHHLWNWVAWTGAEPFPPFDFIATGWVGRAFELIFWVTCAVQLRWLGNSIASDRDKSLTTREYFGLWMLDTFNTPFICWLVLVLLQGLTISFAGGLRLSLAEADIVLFSAICALLGMSVRETRVLLSRMTTDLLKRLSDDKPTAVD